MIQAIVFDFDGVLADSELLHLRAYQEILGPAGIELTKDAYWDRYLGLDDVGVFAQVAADHGLLFADEELEMLMREKGRRFETLVSRDNVLVPAAAAVVRALGREWPIGIASGSLRREIELMLRGAGLSDAFAFIVSAEDTEHSKPAPDPYLLAVERHGCPADACVAIEDSHQGLQSARAAGLRTIGLAGTYPRETLSPFADVVVDSLDAITVDFLRGL
ncbi:MAG TPA: HAD family phosphatase [Vicinamibacterales bacterium]|nr:HAD family phosphatase [Vicinamibacterales bacterium]